MKRLLAATALMGFVLLASGCGWPTAYTIRNRTNVEITVSATRPACDGVPSEYDDFVHEGTIKPGRIGENHDDWATDENVRCLRVLDPERRVILEKPFIPSDGYDDPNNYIIQDATPISETRLASPNDFPGHSFSRKATDFAKSAGTVVLIVLVIVVGLGLGLTVMAFIWGLPIYLAYLLVKAIASIFTKPKAPSN